MTRWTKRIVWAGLLAVGLLAFSSGETVEAGDLFRRHRYQAPPYWVGNPKTIQPAASSQDRVQQHPPSTSPYPWGSFGARYGKSTIHHRGYNNTYTDWSFRYGF